MAELAVFAVAKGVELAMSAENARVRAARHTYRLDVNQRAHEARHSFGAPLAVAELAECAGAPRVHPPAITNGNGVMRAALELPQRLVADGTHQPRQQLASPLAVAEGVVLSIAPSERDAALAQSG